MRELVTIPVFDPGMPFGSAIVAVVKFDIFKAIRQKMRGDPVSVDGHVSFGNIFVVAGPARPDHRSRPKILIIKVRIERHT